MKYLILFLFPLLISAQSFQEYVEKWVEEHKDLRPDSWTNARRTAINEHGVYNK